MPAIFRDRPRGPLEQLFGDFKATLASSTAMGQGARVRDRHRDRGLALRLERRASPVAHASGARRMAGLGRSEETRAEVFCHVGRERLRRSVGSRKSSGGRASMQVNAGGRFARQEVLRQEKRLRPLVLAGRAPQVSLSKPGLACGGPTESGSALGDRRAPGADIRRCEIEVADPAAARDLVPDGARGAGRGAGPDILPSRLADHVDFSTFA